MSFEFDLTPREEPITLGTEKLVMREAPVEACDKYLDAVAACYEYGESGAVKAIKGMPATATLLISLCLFQEDGTPVPQARIKTWPRRVQQILFKKAKELCEVDRDVTLAMLYDQRKTLEKRIKEMEAEEELLKNSSRGTGVGSP